MHLVFFIYKNILPFMLSLNVLTFLEKPSHFTEVELLESLALFIEVRAKVAYFGKDLSEFRNDNDMFGF